MGVTPNRKISKRTIQNLFYAEKLSEIFETNEKVYGSPRLHKAMRKMRFCLGRKRITRIMKLTGIRPITATKFRVKTTDSEHSMPIYENCIDVRTDLFQNIEEFYSRRMLYSYLDYTSPVEFELNMGAA